MESLQGHFLLASPHLLDGNFFRSVVLILRHDSEGALGLVLNRPTTDDISDLWPKVSKQAQLYAGNIYWGGPVTGPLMALHRSEDCSQGNVLPGVYFSAEKANIRELLSQSEPVMRLFTNYSGWGAGQLEEELEAGGWLVTPATADEIFSDSETVWKKLVQQVGLEVMAPAVARGRMPEDPSLN